MIQRVQSIFLALVVGIFITLFFVPIYSIAGPATAIGFQEYLNLGKISGNPILLILLSGISILAIVAIFTYKNRKRQMAICRIGLLISMLVALDAMVFPQFFIHGIDRKVLQFGFGAYLLPVNIVLFALAARFIKKDDDLVKAADRLR